MRSGRGKILETIGRELREGREREGKRRGMWDKERGMSEEGRELGKMENGEARL